MALFALSSRSPTPFPSPSGQARGQALPHKGDRPGDPGGGAVSVMAVFVPTVFASSSSGDANVGKCAG